MEYVTGIWALNLRSPDGTPGDWHFSAINWDRMKTFDTEDSVYGDWALHMGEVPGRGQMPVASHVRACLDLIELGDFRAAGGMRKDFISNEAYTPLIFDKVWMLRESPKWDKIDAFMGREYMCKWLDYKKMK